MKIQNKDSKVYLVEVDERNYIIEVERTHTDVNGNNRGTVTVFMQLNESGEFFVLNTQKIYMNAFVPHEPEARKQFFEQLVSRAKYLYYGN